MRYEEHSCNKIEDSMAWGLGKIYQPVSDPEIGISNKPFAGEAISRPRFQS
jgi:hypothetical protein